MRFHVIAPNGERTTFDHADGRVLVLEIGEEERMRNVATMPPHATLYAGWGDVLPEGWTRERVFEELDAIKGEAAQSAMANPLFEDGGS